MAVKLGTEEIAIFNFASRGEWYAASNMCPHKQQMILARGIIGDKADEPKVVCPYHKKQFSLKSGKNLDDHDCSSIRTYPIKVENGRIYIGL
jgi:nitrite reductase (NADH) small subunit